MDWQKKGVILRKPWLAMGAVFATGFVIGLFIMPPVKFKTQDIQVVRENSPDYEFINPLLFTIGGESLLPEYQPLKDIITNYTESAIAEDEISNVSVYFRNLNSAQWISVNNEETYSPASMLKVITLMATMRAAEFDPELLNERILITGDDTSLVSSQQRYPVEDPIRSGHSYPVETLIDHLIIDSDNVANVALINRISEEKTDLIYEDMQLHLPSESGRGYTSEEYSHLFRTLYNSTYLSRSVSEKVLELLSRTKFDQGLVAGVPEDITVSHKFGSRTGNPNPSTNSASLSEDERELHDCGIVYYPENPYFLCVMTRGSDFDKLERTIQSISKLTWDYFDKKFPK